MPTLQQALEEARHLRDSGRLEDALNHCSQLLVEYPQSTDCYRVRSHVYSRLNDLNAAIADRLRVLSIEEGSAFDFFDLGRWNLEAGRLGDAVEHLTRVLQIEERTEDRPFTATAYLFRAAAYLQLKKPLLALEDCLKIEGDAQGWIPGLGLRSKAEVVIMAKALFNKKRVS